MPSSQKPVEVAFAVQPAATAIAWILAVGALYFLAARLGLAILAKPSNVAVFWPASGIGAGLMAALDPRDRVPVVTGIIAATGLANILGDRDLVLAITFGLCNAGEALLFVWILNRYKPASGFENINGTIWFLTAAGGSAAMMAAIAAQTLVLARPESGAFFDIWKDWWASDAIGIMTFAPLLMALGTELRKPWRGNDNLYGPLALSALVLVASIAYLLPPGETHWWSPVPIATLFPFLLLLGARCRPSYAAAGIALSTLIMVWATTKGHGPFGDSNVPLHERIFNARLTLIAIAFCGLTMVAAFTQQRSIEDNLRANQERFEKLAGSAPGMIYSFRIDANDHYSLPYASGAIGNILGLQPRQVAEDGLAPFHHIHPEDLAPLNQSIAVSRSQLEPWQAEFRYQHPERGLIWLEGHSSPIQDGDGSVTWHGFMQDISQRKIAEAHVQELMGEVNHRANNLLGVVQAVIFHTARDANPKDLAEVLDKRIQALAVSHSLLVAGHWEGVQLETLVARQLVFLGDLVGTRITYKGPPAVLTPAAAQTVGMALHELATNALKYGALSNDRGHVAITWTTSPQFELTWTEGGGPTVNRPTRRGFGYRVLVRMAEHQLDAKVDLDYAEEGVSWRLVAQLARMVDPGRDVGTIITGSNFDTQGGVAMSSMRPPARLGEKEVS